MSAGENNIKDVDYYLPFLDIFSRARKIAKSDDEFAELIELGLEYVGPTPSGNSTFRKRKEEGSSHGAGGGERTQIY